MLYTRLSLLAQVFLYLFAGINHFWHPGFYLNVMPDHYTHPAALVRLSGLAEILGAAGLLLPPTRRLAAAGLILMLIVFLDVHVFMLTHQSRFPGIPAWLLWARLPLQFLLIAWAASVLQGRKRMPAISAGI